MRLSLWSVPLVVAVLGVTGCEGQACTLMGSLDGVSVSFAPELQLVSGSVAVTVCDDDDCASVEEDWARRASYGGLMSFAATFDDLGRSFDDGTVQVLVELSDASGELLASRRADVELTRDWPNGKDCDGDGFLNGHLELRSEDAVPTAS